MTATLSLAKAHLGVTHDDQDALITQYLASAEAWLERYTGLLLGEQTVVENFEAFDGYLELHRGPVVELTSVAYVDAEGADQTVTDPRLRKNRIYAPVAGWPTIEDYSTITVTYVAGFDVAYDEAPQELVQAQLMLVAHWYSQRETAGPGLEEVPFGVTALAKPFRLPVLR